jgi:RNA polymerase II subunit A-like phosphatase
LSDATGSDAPTVDTGPGEIKKCTSKEAEDDLIEVEDNDDYLMYLEDILKTIHKAYYELYDQVGHHRGW